MSKLLHTKSIRSGCLSNSAGRACAPCKAVTLRPEFHSNPGRFDIFSSKNIQSPSLYNIQIKQNTVCGFAEQYGSTIDDLCSPTKIYICLLHDNPHLLVKSSSLVFTIYIRSNVFQINNNKPHGYQENHPLSGGNTKFNTRKADRP